jgi:hypothetical protein
MCAPLISMRVRDSLIGGGFETRPYRGQAPESMANDLRGRSLRL